MKITVMGPGGVGGYFGARLAAAGNDVTFVARGAHLAAMRKSGLRLDSEIGMLHLDPVQVVADAGEIAAADAIIFAVKMGDTENAARSLQPLAAISPNIQREIWMKFAMLAPLAAMTALTRGPIGPVRANAQSRALLQAAVEETVAVGVALETGLESADTAKVMHLIDTFPNTMMASMAHDLLAGKPIELDGLSGAVVRLGSRCGVPTPTHRFVTQALAPFVGGKPVV